MFNVPKAYKKPPKFHCVLTHTWPIKEILNLIQQEDSIQLFFGKNKVGFKHKHAAMR